MKWFSPLKNLWTKSPKTQKIKLIVMLLLLGFLLILFPSSQKKEASNPRSVNIINQPNNSAKELETLLTDLIGNKVKVMVSYADSGRTDVIREEIITAETQNTTGVAKHQKEEKPVLDSSKNVQIENKLSPRIKGVCVFCFAPYEKETEELLYRAAKGALGAELHTVEVIFKSSSSQ